ncbi:TetR/AcrR family transcriptional regulator [Marinithermus hydrothermalis]|uniref:Regulatory protein TetR n=1 Tax=Marinithermus hydrothermalis (strain DSM 14884 / JCM 11576 / T1) TaxID=869210 RepID=F2NN20_MARHT|nr:TetR/AcrR family transcriptional regulator [Marinithermus hydrothermalis]AEB12759.1 regulatory protein TetR [Marinithermus hydrothermalis DSM 14884]
MATEARNVVDKRTQILEATIRVLRERGISGLKVEDVAREAEVGKGTVYLYFEDKQDLLRALVEHRTLSFYEDVRRLTQEARPFRERLAALLERRLAFVDEWRGLWAAVAREAHPSDQAGWLKGLHERYQRILESFVESGVRSGELRPDLDIPLTAATLAALGCSPQLDFPREAYIAHLVEVLMKGVGT